MLQLEGNWVAHSRDKKKKRKKNKTGQKENLSKDGNLKKNRIDITRKGTEIWKKQGSSQWTSKFNDKWKPRGKISDKCNGKISTKENRAQMKPFFLKCFKKLIIKQPQWALGGNLWLSLNIIIQIDYPILSSRS